MCSTSSAASGGKPMVPDAHEVVQAAVNGLRATCSISMQHPVAMGWSTDLASAPTCTVEEPMRTSQHRRQTGCRSSPVCRCGSCTPPGTLQLMCPAASEPLSSRARHLEAWRARGRPRQPPWLVRRSSFRGPCVKGLCNHDYMGVHSLPEIDVGTPAQRVRVRGSARAYR